MTLSASFLAAQQGLYLGVAAAFGALCLLLVTLLRGPRTSGLRLLRRELKVAARPAGPSHSMQEAGALANSISRKAVGLVEQMPKPAGFEERLQDEIERAGWQLRATEFLTLQVGATLLPGAATLVLGGNILVALAVASAGFVMPRLVLSRQVRRRSAAFLSQLPDTLQLLSASLRAGYGLLQAVDTVVKEVPAPMAAEFARVLTEARLGMPLEEALEGMAERVKIVDFRWVVMAINIQRKVGGNLAQVLEGVADTLRERAQILRQVKVLSAEGRLSGIILFFLPIALSAYMTLVNRAYIATLLSSIVGEAMVVLAALLMVVGGLWMRKVVNIKI